MTGAKMGYSFDLKIWNDGHMDGWNTTRDPVYGMS